MGQTTITVHDETLERFKDLKRELNENHPESPDHSAESFLNALLDTWDRGDPDAPVPAVGDLEPFGGEVPEIDIDGVDVDPAELSRELSKQLDYNLLAAKVGEELEGRLR